MMHLVLYMIRLCSTVEHHPVRRCHHLLPLVHQHHYHVPDTSTDPEVVGDEVGESH